MVSHVDDNILVAKDEKTILDFLARLEKTGLKFTIEGDLTAYLGIDQKLDSQPRNHNPNADWPDRKDHQCMWNGRLQPLLDTQPYDSPWCVQKLFQS